MGNKTGKATDHEGLEKIPTFKESLHKFHGKELKDLKKTFKELSKYSNTSDKTVTKKVFEEHFLVEKTSDFHLPESLADHIFSAFDLHGKENINFEQFVIGMAMCCYGSNEEKMDFCFHILAASKWGDNSCCVTRTGLIEMLSTTVTSVNKLLNTTTNEDEELNIKTLVDDAFDHFAKTDPDKLTYEEFKQWAETNTHVIDYFEFLLHKGFYNKYTPSVQPTLPEIPPPLPNFFLENGSSAVSDLLNQDGLSRLRDGLPHRFWNSDFELVYKPSIHGYSLKTLYARALNRGPVVVVVKDNNGHVFGAFSSQPIRVDHNFYGDHETFMFQLHPETNIYLPDSGNTGNTNYIQTTNHFMGFGGPDFSLWLDTDIDKGVSKECATFASPSMASSPDFHCVQLEVWAFKHRVVEHHEKSGKELSTSSAYRSPNLSRGSLPEKSLPLKKEKDTKEEKKEDKAASAPVARRATLTSPFSFLGKDKKEKKPKKDKKGSNSSSDSETPPRSSSPIGRPEDVQKIQELESSNHKLTQELHNLKKELEQERRKSVALLSSQDVLKQDEETKPTETKSAETKPAETKPAEELNSKPKKKSKKEKKESKEESSSTKETSTKEAESSPKEAEPSTKETQENKDQESTSPKKSKKSKQGSEGEQATDNGVKEKKSKKEKKIKESKE